MAATHSSDAGAGHRFQELCSRLQMTSAFARSAWEVVEKVSPQVEMKQEDEPFWFACGILTCMLAARLEDPAQRPCTSSLSEVLQQSNVRLVDVFEPMQDFVELAKPAQAESIKKEMDLLARRFIVMSLFTKKYKDMFSTLFSYPQRSSVSGEYSFGWLLFLSAKANLLSNTTDVVHLLNALLCCINLLYVLSPPEQRKLKLGADGEEEQQALSALANMYSANAADLQSMYDTHFLPYLHKLSQTDVLSLGGPQSFSEPLSTKQLQGLMEEDAMESNVALLAKQYLAQQQDSISINELALLQTPEEIGTPSKMPPKMKQYYNYQGTGGVTQPQRMGEKSPLSPRSPVTPRTIRVTIPATPLTSTMQTLSWLERVVSQQGDGPSKALKVYFKACQTNPMAAITKRVAEVTRQVEFTREQDTARPESRRKQAAKLYYRLLEAMLAAEEQRLQTKDFAALLSQDMFHRSLIACCMEITAYCYKLDHLRYPHITDTLSIEPFEYCKIIENVLRHEVTIPLVLKRHLMRIEEQILEEDAWKEGSSLFTLLTRPGQQEHIYQQFHVAGSQTAAGSEASAKQVPQQVNSLTPSRLRRKSAAPLHSPAPSKVGGGSSTPGSAPRSRSLELFFKKVLSLANVRMQQLFKRMEVPAGIYHHLWFSFVHELIWFPQIIKNRHLDQIIMCTLYGVCRANKLESVTFRKMLDGYRHQPQASSTLWRNVLLEDGERGDIIKFYNQVFITMLEDVLWKYQGRVPQGSSFAPAASPMKVAPKYNLYLSPLKGSKFLTASNSSGGIRYSIGQSPAKGLEDINKNLVSVGTKRKASRKLDFTALATAEPKRQRTGDDGDASPLREDIAMDEGSPARTRRRKSGRAAN